MSEFNITERDTENAALWQSGEPTSGSMSPGDIEDEEEDEEAEAETADEEE